MQLKDKIALITGASRGIGRAVALEFAKEGAHVIALARTQGALEALDDEINEAGGKATLLKLDLKKLDEVDKIGPSLHERFGRLDIFIGNAGILGPLSPVHQVAQKDWDKVMTTNFAANVRLVHTLDPLLRAAPSGRVMFTGTEVAQDSLAYWGPYAASKAALSMFAKTYAAETMKTNMRINMVNPGVVETEMLKEAFPGGYQGKINMPEQAAKIFLRLALEGCNAHGETVAA